MESKFTKGKWVFEERPSNWFDILEEKSRRNILRSDLLGHEQLLANAQLIASAPEMFELLNKVNDFIIKNKSQNYIVELLRREVPEINELLTKISTL